VKRLVRETAQLKERQWKCIWLTECLDWTVLHKLDY